MLRLIRHKRGTLTEGNQGNEGRHSRDAARRGEWSGIEGDDENENEDDGPFPEKPLQRYINVKG